jgi:hypothetical protein
MREIPPDPEGYAVDVELGYVHSRYADHAVGCPRTRSVAGVRSLLASGPGVGRACTTCYPPPPPPAPRRREPAKASLPPPPVVDLDDDGSTPTTVVEPTLEDA